MHAFNRSEKKYAFLPLLFIPFQQKQTEIYTPLDLTENGQNGYIRSHRF